MLYDFFKNSLKISFIFFLLIPEFVLGSSYYPLIYGTSTDSSTLADFTFGKDEFSGEMYSQKFIFDRDIDICEFYLSAKKYGNPTDNFRVKIYSGMQYDEGYFVISSPDISPSQLATTTLTGIKFSWLTQNCINLTAGQKYWFVIDRTGDDDVDNYYGLGRYSFGASTMPNWNGNLYTYVPLNPGWEPIATSTNYHWDWAWFGHSNSTTSQAYLYPDLYTGSSTLPNSYVQQYGGTWIEKLFRPITQITLALSQYFNMDDATSTGAIMASSTIASIAGMYGILYPFRSNPLLTSVMTILFILLIITIAYIGIRKAVNLIKLNL